MKTYENHLKTYENLDLGTSYTVLLQSGPIKEPRAAWMH